MAEIRVVILPQGVRDFATAPWTEIDHSSPQLDKWKESATLWPKRLLQAQDEPMEVFFCLDAEVLAEGYDFPVLYRLIQQAHQAMWGARIYFVIDNQWRPAQQDPEQPEPYLWIRDLLENKVFDVLEWSVRSTSNYTEAARRSGERMETLGRYRSQQPWKCLPLDEQILTRIEQRLLSVHWFSPQNKLAGDNCVIVGRFSSYGYLGQIEQKIEELGADKVIIGWIDSLEVPPELETFCRVNGHELVRFHGVAELFYFLQKLNEPILSISPIEDERLMGHEGTPVRVTNFRFQSYNPQLLITHSYLSGERENCFSASTDTWELIKDLPANVRVQIYPAIRSVKLAAIVSQFDQLLAWIHIGHGDAEKGLQQSDDEVFKSASDWINSFAGYKSTLPLVLFSSCYSEFVAQEFAEAGVGVAIGFAKTVNTRVCAQLTKRVVEAALKFNGERTAILQAFLAGHDVLNTEDPNAVPKAFWSSD